MHIHDIRKKGKTEIEKGQNEKGTPTESSGGGRNSSILSLLILNSFEAPAASSFFRTRIIKACDIFL